MQGLSKNSSVFHSISRLPIRRPGTNPSCHRPELVPRQAVTHRKVDVRASRMDERQGGGGRLPVIIFDVMDTIVKDPFYTHMPGFFGMTFEELLKAKHPTAWGDFEKGKLSQEEFDVIFFKDGRTIDSMGLRAAMSNEYQLIEGMEGVLQDLRSSGYSMHVMSNYPIWYKLVEQQCQVSRFMPWTFISCEGPMQGLRKPDPACFECAMRELQVQGADIIFIDDRKANTDAAQASGLQAIHFKGAEDLRTELKQLGVEA